MTILKKISLTIILASITAFIFLFKDSIPNIGGWNLASTLAAGFGAATMGALLYSFGLLGDEKNDQT